ncbi:MAG: hypothetical protein ACI9HY_003526 [Planctomycetaceae bacterium]|jgi:hypothetical protein
MTKIKVRQQYEFDPSLVIESIDIRLKSAGIK